MEALALQTATATIAKQTPHDIVNLNPESNPMNTLYSSYALITATPNWHFKRNNVFAVWASSIVGDVTSVASDAFSDSSQQINDQLNSLKKNLQNLKLDVGELILSFNSTNWTDSSSIAQAFQPILDPLKPVLNYIVQNPTVLNRLLVPAIETLLEWMGFTRPGPVQGSIAAALRNTIATVATGTVLDVLEGDGIAEIGAASVACGPEGIAIALILGTIFLILVATGVIPNTSALDVINLSWGNSVKTFGLGNNNATSVANQLQIYAPPQGPLRGMTVIGWVVLVVLLINIVGE